MIKEKYIDKAWNEVNILDVFHDFHPELEVKQKGSRYVCLCPYHDDHNPSLNIEPSKNRVRCFVCGTYLTLFKLVQYEKKLSYPEAIRYIYENYLQEIPIKEIYDFGSKDDEQRWKKKEIQKSYMAMAHKFFRQEYLRDYHMANFCRDYAEKSDDNPEGRWSKELCDQLELGYAPGSGNALVDWARGQHLDFDVLQSIGLVYKLENDDGTCYYKDSFRNRLMTPYRDKWSEVIAYTGRKLDYKPGDKDKYKNNSCKKGENEIFDKYTTLWGLNSLGEVRKSKKAYLVEGASDAMSILDLGIENVVASIGGEWTEGQLKSLKSADMPLLCFIPDIDEQNVNVEGAIMGNGEKFTIRSAFRAMKLGFTVTVKAIPPSEDGSKVDAGDYFTDIKRWNKVKEEDFVIWYAGKYFNKSVSDSENSKAVKTVCRMLLDLHDDELCNFYFRQLKKKYKSTDVWEDAMRMAKGDVNSNSQQKSKEEFGINLMDKSMIAKDGCLYSITKNNDAAKKLTNFIPRSLYHVKDGKESLRIVEVNNHKDKPCIIAFSQEELSKMDKCISRLGVNGNYSLFTNADEFKLFRALLYEGLQNVKMVDTIGWFKCGDDGFQVYGNGIFANKTWQKANEFGIVEYCGECYYIPSCSKVNENSNDAMVQNMKRYNHWHDSSVTIEEYFDKVEGVFGDNGIVTLIFGIATMFRDIIFETTGFIPLEFIFGPNMSGKTTLAKNALHLFVNSNQMANLGSSSLAGITRLMAMLSNVPILINEYFDTIGLQKIDIIKGLFEGTGRIMSTEDNDSFTQFTANCTLILTGQDLPDYDPAMFSRSLLVEQYEAVFDGQAITRLEELKKYHNKGLTTITLSLLRHREDFMAEWQESWKRTVERFNDDADLTGLPQRVIECWSILYAVIDCLKESGAKIPINRNRLYNICVEYITRQCEMMKNSDELAKFWAKIDSAHTTGKLIEGVSYRVQYVDDQIEVSKKRNHKILTNKDCPHRILLLYMKSAYEVIESMVKKDDKVISESSFKHYLENSAEFIGTKVRSTYFRVADEQGNLLMTAIPDPKTGNCIPLRKSARPMVFNYDSLCNKYDINLIDNEPDK